MKKVIQTKQIRTKVRTIVHVIMKIEKQFKKAKLKSWKKQEI